MSREHLLDDELYEVNGGAVETSVRKEELGSEARLNQASMMEEMKATGIIKEEVNGARGFMKDNLAKANIADAQKGVSRFFGPIAIIARIFGGKGE